MQALGVKAFGSVHSAASPSNASDPSARMLAGLPQARTCTKVSLLRHAGNHSAAVRESYFRPKPSLSTTALHNISSNISLLS